MDIRRPWELMMYALLNFALAVQWVFRCFVVFLATQPIFSCMYLLTYTLAEDFRA